MYFVHIYCNNLSEKNSPHLQGDSEAVSESRFSLFSDKNTIMSTPSVVFLCLNLIRSYRSVAAELNKKVKCVVEFEHDGFLETHNANIYSGLGFDTLPAALQKVNPNKPD